jgi:predicted AlkP superfamily phosphohydrolase/phosphomutase
MRKVLVIGLDGAPFELIQQWSESNDLPNLAKLIARGSFGVLRSTIPVHSPTAWSSFITGLNPGKHGVFDFVRREPASYQLRVIRADQIEADSLWRRLSRNGRRVGVINVPMTYPPEEVNGFLVTGLGTPDYTPYTYPPELSHRLDEEGYRVNKRFFYRADMADEWLEDIFKVSERQAKATLKLMEQEPWDFFMVVFRNTDEICHFFWHHMDSSHPEHTPDAPLRYKNAIRNFYHYIDDWVGKIVAQAGENTNIIVMSDHGAGPLYKDVFINEWLWQQGWLKLKDDVIRPSAFTRGMRTLGITRKKISDTLTRLHLHRLEVFIKNTLGDRIQVLPRDERPEFANAIDWRHTKAYSFGYYGQIFINLRGREPDGIVEPGAEYDQLRQEIIASLNQLVDPEDDLPIVDKIYTKEELYHGPYLHDAPDLLAIMRGFSYTSRKGYEFAQKRGDLFRKPYTNETGSHRIEGILIASGPDIVAGQKLQSVDIQDLTPTLLHLLHCPIPAIMDGSVIQDILTADYREQHLIEYVDEETHGRETESDNWDEEAEAEITERLKNLGYLG